MGRFYLRKSILFLVIATAITGLSFGLVAVRNRRLARDATAGLAESRARHDGSLSFDGPGPS